MSARTHYGMCNFCDAMCGLEVVHDGRTIERIRGDTADPFSRGHVCPKGIAQKELFDDPDRLRQPIRRDGNRWRTMGWDEALTLVATRLADLQRRHGQDAVGLYLGNPVGHNYRSMLAAVGLAAALDTRNLYSSNSVDAHPRTLVSMWLYGNQALLPVPDIERTDLLVIQGANPMITHGSIMAAPDTRRRLRSIRQRGGRIVVLDPRFTETAAIADEHLFVRPGSDAALLMAVLHVLHREGRLQPWRDGRRLRGVAEFVALLGDFAPERVSAFVGIEPAAIRRLARDFAAAPRAAWYGRMGTSTQTFGCLATWLIDVLNLLTGNFDRPGGVMFTTPAVDLARLAAFVGQTGGYDRWRSRVAGLPEVGGEFPVVTLPDEIETAGPGQIRGLLTVAGNPVLSNPNGRRLDGALTGLEFMAAVDFYVNETTRHADVILPPATALEDDHYPMLEAAMAIRNVARYAPRMVDPEAGVRHDADILLSTAQRLVRRRGGWRRLLAPVLGATRAALASGTLLDLLLRIGPHRLRLADLQAAPHGIDLGPLQPRFDAVIATADRRIALVPAPLKADLERLRRALAVDANAADGLRLISQRTMNSMNSWLHNSPLLTAGRNRCVLAMHPDDAAARGLENGTRARLASARGAIEVEIAVSQEVMPGVVAMPYGWDNARSGTQLRIAKARGGASFNDVADERDYDRVSGTAVLDGIAVDVERVPAVEPRAERA